MELNSIEMEMRVLKYLKLPNDAFRTRIDKKSALFDTLNLEYLELANPEEIAQIANQLDVSSLSYSARSESLMAQADRPQALS